MLAQVSLVFCLELFHLSSSDFSSNVVKSICEQGAGRCCTYWTGDDRTYIIKAEQGLISQGLFSCEVERGQKS